MSEARVLLDVASVLLGNWPQVIADLMLEQSMWQSVIAAVVAAVHL